MTIPSLPISRLVNVSVNLAPQAAQSQNISTLLVLGNSAIIDVVERIRTYSSLAAVAAEFGTSAPEYLAAVLWFEQAPQPTQLKIGRWAQTATKGLLVGGSLSAAEQAIAAWNLITAPGFLVTLNGVPQDIHPASFATATNLNGIATLIQSALPASCTCVWNADFALFQITSNTSGVGSSVSFLSAPASVGNIVFGSNPANLDTITLNGTVITFVTGTPTSGQLKVQGTLALTLAALVTYISSSSDVELKKFVPSVDPTGAKLQLVAATAGVGGDSLTIAASVATPSAGTLAGGTGTDVSAMLGMTSTFSGAYVADGIAAETASDCVALFDLNFGQTWYGLAMPTAIDADSLLVSPYIEGANNKHVFGLTTQEAGVLSSVSTTDIAYEMKQLGYRRTCGQYSSANAYAVASLLGRALTVNYNGNNTVITLMYKQEPGIVAETINETQLTALEAKNCNVFVEYNNDTAIIEQGRMFSGNFIDEITGTDWLALTIQNVLYNLLYTTPTKIPQTDAGMHLLATAVEGVCSQAVTNGLLAPGVWNSQGFGSLAQGDFLAKGFYVYAPPVALQTQADREARKSVPIQVAAKLAGAVHTIDVLVTVNR